MRNELNTVNEPTDEEVARYAYFLWESEGCIHGRDLDYWLQAKTHLKAFREHDVGSFENPSQTAEPVRQATRASRKRQSRAAREPAYA